VLDLGEGRIEAMDRAAVDLQILSLTTPGVEPLEPGEAVDFALRTNDLLGAAVARESGTVRRLLRSPDVGPAGRRGRVGANRPRTRFQRGDGQWPLAGTYLDDESTWPLLERAEGSRSRSTCTDPSA